MEKYFLPKRKLTSFQIISFGFLGVIFLGAFLLMLPFSSLQNRVTPFLDALFTSTSAVCVTGLVVYDTAVYWSTFGQLVIMLLIQIGGMGVITVAAAFATVSGQKISLMQRSTMQEAIAAPTVGGIVRLTGFIIKTTLVMELLGAAAMAPVFCRDFGKKGLWMALFHSVSAFCNAGFDLLGSRGAFSSLISYVGEPIINVTVMLLIVVGGIGFLTWDDVRSNGLHFRRYRMQSKIILCTTALLLAVPALYFFFFELAALPVKERILASLFQSVTPRTAGFCTVDLTSFTEASAAIVMALMLIGGSPGSTAGGMKTTTLAVLAATAVSTFRRQKSPHFFGRRIDDSVAKSAAAILMLYLTLFFFGGLFISIAEGLPVLPCLFEAASALGTVGLSLGCTAKLGTLSKSVLIALMFCGRVGGLTLIFAMLSGTQKSMARYPRAKVIVG